MMNMLIIWIIWILDIKTYIFIESYIDKYRGQGIRWYVYVSCRMIGNEFIDYKKIHGSTLELWSLSQKLWWKPYCNTQWVSQKFSGFGKRLTEPVWDEAEIHEFVLRQAKPLPQQPHSHLQQRSAHPVHRKQWRPAPSTRLMKIPPQQTPAAPLQPLTLKLPQRAHARPLHCQVWPTRQLVSPDQPPRPRAVVALLLAQAHPAQVHRHRWQKQQHHAQYLQRLRRRRPLHQKRPLQPAPHQCLLLPAVLWI